jgi:hypothetical protein
MKTWQKGTALHIAVFLLLFIGGCYTTLRSPSHLNDTTISDAQYERAEWDFGRGWYYQTYGAGSNYFYYHSMPWWYNRHQNYQIDTESAANDSNRTGDGKITRRNDDAPYQGNAALPLQPIIPRDSLNTTNPPQTPPDSTIKLPTNMTDDKNKDIYKNGQNNNSDKVIHRGRR